MRLLECSSDGKLSLTRDFVGNDVPEYAILSHTWGANSEEVSFIDLIDGTGMGKAGYKKIYLCAEQARRDGLQYFWVDTCCIDKSSSAVLSESIISMFRWYQNASKCYVYLLDVQLSWELAFRKSRWFTRGWTLQELLAPKSVEFYSQDWEHLGDKRSLEQLIHEITGLPVKALQGIPLYNFSVAERLSWAERRFTSREEDKAYSLLGIFNVQMPALYGEGKDQAFKRLLKEIDDPLKRFDDDLLQYLPHAVDAPFNSFQRQHEPTCLADTRVELLQKIYNWADGQNDGFIFWLNGAAGTGKSTIARTVARRYYEQRRLGASFFFSRGGGDVSHAGKFFTSIALQLANQSNTLRRHIGEAISRDRTIASKGLRDQWAHLIIQPLSKLGANQFHLPLIIVVDALDECDDDNNIRAILSCFVDLKNLVTTRLYICITSRPETPIRLGFRAMPEIVYHDFILHNVPRAIVDEDISLYFRDKFKELRDVFEDVPAGWPGDDNINLLVQKAEGLFIYAATVLRFVKGDEEWPPQGLLDTFLSRTCLEPRYASDLNITFASPTGELDQMYTMIIQHSFKNVQQNKSKVIELFKQVIGSLVVLSEPLSAAALARLLDLPIEWINRRLQSMHSVLNIPKDQSALIRLHHPSFRDFLLDKARCSNLEFWVDKTQMHRGLADKSIRLMSKSLRQDICVQKAPGMLAVSVGKRQILRCIPPEVNYACLYWILHLQRSNSAELYHEEVQQFLQVNVLHWFEALGWIGKITEGIRAILSLEAEIPADKLPDLGALLYDVKRFALYNRSIVEQAPLQVYCSALIFAPRNSIVWGLFSERFIPNWIQRIPKVQANWEAALQTLEGHSKTVTSVAFSSDSKLVASGSKDKTIRLWDTATGALQQTLKGHSGEVHSVAFSPDSKVVASGSWDKTVRLWDPLTGVLLHTLRGHSKAVNSVAFSADSKLFASGSWDNTVRLWDTSTWVLQQKLKDHLQLINSVAFSSDSKFVASGSNDKTVRLWDTATGELQQTLRGHSSEVRSIAFSPDSKVVASGSRDKTVRLWNPLTGTLLHTVKGHSNEVNSVAFSADSKFIILGCENGMEIRDVSTGDLQQMFEGHSGKVGSAAFSPDSRIVASGSTDQTVRLWDVATGLQKPRLAIHLNDVHLISFSSDGRFVVSVSQDMVRLYDAATGAWQRTFEIGYEPEPISSLAISPDNKHAVSLSHNTIMLWDMASGALQHSFLSGWNMTKRVTFSPDSKLAIASYWDESEPSYWDVATGAQQQPPEDYSYMFPGDASSPTTKPGKLFASEEWIEDDDMKILWLPPDYRPTSQASWNGRIVLGHASGRISFFEFAPGPKLICI